MPEDIFFISFILIQVHSLTRSKHASRKQENRIGTFTYVQVKGKVLMRN